VLARLAVSAFAVIGALALLRWVLNRLFGMVTLIIAIAIVLYLAKLVLSRRR